MALNRDFVSNLPAQYFWDTDYSKLDDDQSRRIIIERVISLGSMREITGMIMHYGEQEVINTICRLSYLDPKTLNFASRLFGIPKIEFKCYISKASKPQLWNS